MSHSLEIEGNGFLQEGQILRNRAAILSVFAYVIECSIGFISYSWSLLSCFVDGLRVFRHYNILHIFPNA